MMDLVFYINTNVCSLGARVNAKDNKWLTPLHRAVASCSEVHAALSQSFPHQRLHHPNHTWSVLAGGRPGASETLGGRQCP